MDQVKKSGRISLDCTVDRLVQEFLEYAQKNNAEATYIWYLHFLQSFRDHVGYELTVRDFGLAHVNGWLSTGAPISPVARHTPPCRRPAVHRPRAVMRTLDDDGSKLEASPTNGEATVDVTFSIRHSQKPIGTVPMNFVV